MALDLFAMAAKGPAKVPALGRSAPMQNDAAFASDSANALGMGGGDLYEALGAVTEFVAPEVGRKMQEQAGSIRGWFEGNLSDTAREALQKKFFSVDEQSALRDPRAVWLNVVRQVPNIASLVIPGSAVGRGAQLAGAGLKAAARIRAGTTAASGAVVGAGQGAAEAAQGLEQQGITDPEARDSARAVAAGVGGLAGLLLGPLEAKFLTGAATRGVSKQAAQLAAAKRAGQTLGKLRGAAASGAKGAAVNAGEETIQQAGIELGKDAGGGEADWMQLPEAATAAATTGAASMAGARVLGTVARPLGKEARANRAAKRAAQAAAAQTANRVVPPAAPGATAPAPTPTGTVPPAPTTAAPSPAATPPAPPPAPTAPPSYVPPVQTTLFGVPAAFSGPTLAKQEAARQELATERGVPPAFSSGAESTPAKVRRKMTSLSPQLDAFAKRAEAAAIKARGKSAGPLFEAQPAGGDLLQDAKGGGLFSRPDVAEQRYKEWQKRKAEADKANTLTDKQVKEQAGNKAAIEDLAKIEQSRRSASDGLLTLAAAPPVKPSAAPVAPQVPTTEPASTAAQAPPNTASTAETTGQAPVKGRRKAATPATGKAGLPTGDASPPSAEGAVLAAAPAAPATDAPPAPSAEPSTPPADPNADAAQRLYDQAVGIALAKGTGVGASLIGRQLGIGQRVAAQLIDRMESEGLLGPANAKGQRDVVDTEVQRLADEATERVLSDPELQAMATAPKRNNELFRRRYMQLVAGTQLADPQEVKDGPAIDEWISAINARIAESQRPTGEGAPGAPDPQLELAVSLPGNDPRVDPSAESVVPPLGAKGSKLKSFSDLAGLKAKMEADAAAKAARGQQRFLMGTTSLSAPVQNEQTGGLEDTVVTAQGEVLQTLPPVEQPTDGTPFTEANAYLGDLFRRIRQGPVVAGQTPGVLADQIVDDTLYGLLKGPAKATFAPLLRALMQAGASRTTVYVRPMNDADPREAGRAAFYDPDTNSIVIDESRVAPDYRVHLLTHELAHAATVRFLRGKTLQSQSANDKISVIKRDLADALQAHATYLTKFSRAAGRMELAEQQIAYARQIEAMPNEELVAAALSDPAFAEMLRETKPVSRVGSVKGSAGVQKTADQVTSLWSRVRRVIDQMLGLNRINAADTMQEVLENASRYSATAATDPILTASKLDENVGPAGWTVFAALTAAGRYMNPYAAVAGIGATVANPGNAAQPVWTAQDRWRRRLRYDALHTDHLLLLYKDGLDAMTGGVAGSALQAYSENNEALAHEAKRLTEPAVINASRFEEYNRQNPQLATVLLSVMNDSTMYQLDPELPATDPRNRTGMSRPAAASRYNALQQQWQALDAEGQQLYRDTRRVNEDNHRAYVDAIIKGILTQVYRETDPTTGQTRPRVPLSVAEADAARVYAGITTSNQLLSLPGIKPGKAKGLARVFDTKTVDGPYFPLLRPHPWFVIAGDPNWTTQTYTQAQWDALTDEALNVDPQSIKRLANGDIQARVRRYIVSTAPSSYQAEQLKQELASRYTLSAVKKNRDEFRGSSALIADASELDQLLDAATEGVPANMADAVRNNLLELFAQRAAEGSTVHRRIHRDFVGGASRAFIEGTTLMASVTARQVARTIHDPRRQEARKIMLDEADRIRSGNSKGADHIDQIVATLGKRNELVEALANNPQLGQDLLSRLTNFTATMFLTAPMTVITNGLQPFVVAFPMMAGKHGPSAAAAALMDASKRTMGGFGSQLASSWKRTLAGHRMLDPKLASSGQVADTLHSRMTDGLTPDERRMINELVASNQIDFTSTDDLMQMTDPRREGESRGMWKQVQEFLFTAPRLTETFNRVNTAVAAYNLALQGNPANHDAATRYASEMVRRTQFNYEQNNKSVLFLQPALRAALVFKQYAYQMTMLYLREGYLAINGTATEKAQSRMTLGVLSAVLFAGAGAAGATPELLWAPFRAFCKLLGYDDPETIVRKGVEALTGSTTAGVMAAKGPLSVLLGTDLQRIGVSNMILPRDLFDAETPTDFGKAVMEWFIGAPGGLITSTMTAMDRIGKGDVMGGLAQAIPLKIVSNPMMAAHWLAHGYTDTQGRQLMTPEELGLWGIGQKALGATPMEVAEVQSFRRASYKAERDVTGAKTDIYGRWADAMMNRDREALSGLRQEIKAFNRENPASRITGGTLEAAVRERRKVQQTLLRNRAPASNKAALRRAEELRRIYAVPSSA